MYKMDSTAITTLDNSNKPYFSDENIGYIIGIVIFLLLAIFVIVIFIAWAMTDNSSITNLIPIESGTFLSPCTTQSCNQGLICDGTSFLCKLGTGSQCSDFTDCATGLVCSGICATGPTGGLNQLCPCKEGFLCTQAGNLLTICKGAGGTPCQNNSDCASGLCEQSFIGEFVCAAGAPNAFPCSMNSQCASLNCNNGFCQNLGVITGTLGSACAKSQCVGYTGAQCASSFDNPLTCECLDGSGEPGTCVAVTQGVISVCSPLRSCAQDLVCFDTFARECNDGETGCLCLFPYTDVNTLATGSTCINGMSTVGSLNSCFNNSSLGCDSGGLCSSGLCNGPSVLAVYRFGKVDDVNMGIRYVGATTTEIQSATIGPTGIIQPHKMFATSGVVNDTIYLVDSLQGFLSIVYDPFAETPITPWIQLIPSTSTTTVGNTTTTKKLIDVGYNGTNFLVAFDETVTGTGGFTLQNDTVYIGTSPNNLIPFNVQTQFVGLTGTQFTTTGTPLSINYIDISRANDISPGNDVLISFNGTIYIKQSTQTLYDIGIIQGGPMNGQSMMGLTGPARFYFDNIQNIGGTGSPICPETSSDSDNPIQCPSYYNTSFVGPFTGFGGGNYDQVLQFSGNVAGIADPIDRFEETVHIQYRVFDYSIFSTSPAGMTEGGVIMLTNVFLNNVFIDNMVVLSFGGNTTPIPYRISNTSRSAASGNAYYVISIGSCS